MKLKTLIANFKLIGFIIKTTKKYATTHLTPHHKKRIEIGIPIGKAKIAGIIKLIKRLIKNAKGFQIISLILEIKK